MHCFQTPAHWLDLPDKSRACINRLLRSGDGNALAFDDAWRLLEGPHQRWLTQQSKTHGLAHVSEGEPNNLWTAHLIRPFAAPGFGVCAEVHRWHFIRQIRSLDWLRSNLNVAAQNLLLVPPCSRSNGVGYIIWTQKAGSGPKWVLELKQMRSDLTSKAKEQAQRLITSTLARRGSACWPSTTVPL